MKPNKKDFFEDDLDRDWVHTEVLGRGGKKAGAFTNLVLVVVLVCAVILIVAAIKDMTSKNDLSSLENTDKIKQELLRQEEEAKAKLEESKKETEEESEAKEETEVVLYTVESGDTLAGIAIEFGIADYKTIASANGLEEPYSLEVGQTLKIPGVKKTQPVEEEKKDTPVSSDSSNTYTVKSGDTLAGIGITLGVSWEEMAKLNGIEAPYSLEVGQVLKIPAR